MFTVKRGAAALAVAIIILSCAAGALCEGIAYAATYSAPVIVIDAGHGGIDAGVRGKTSGIKESDVNLAIAYELREYFLDAGFSAVLTRKSQAGLYGVPTKGFKRRDMQSRRDVIISSGADMVISVHQNFYSDSSRRGAQVFFDNDSESGKKLAVCIQNSLNSMENATRAVGPLVGDYYMLKCTESPSVIVECGFLSNYTEAEKLADDSYQSVVAGSVVRGILQYIND